MTRYTDDDLDRIEREAQAMLAEAQGTLNRSEQLFEYVGLSDDKTVSDVLQKLGSPKELDELRSEHIGDLDRELLEEEKRLAREARDNTPVTHKRRRHMARV